MIIPKIPLAQTVIQLCEAKGIKHVVISPGSRNAPLTIGFTNNNFFKCYSIVDERCAAFFALGIAQQLQQAVALVCTSGSALLNYYPAIAEAYYSQIPLVILSADRPKYLVGIGDGQTINQPDVYGKHVLYSANLKQDIRENKYEAKDELPIFKTIENKLEKFLNLQQSVQQYNEQEINMAINTVIVNNAPVHINIPFNEPLYETIENYSVHTKNIVPNINLPANNAAEACLNQWKQASKIMVLVGVLAPNTIEEKYIELLSNNKDVVVLTETTSNLSHTKFINSIDKVITNLTKPEEKLLKPELLLTIGGLIVSKRIKKYLRNHKPKQHWHIGKTRANDTFFCLSGHVNIDVNLILNQTEEFKNTNTSTYQEQWLALRDNRQLKYNAYLKTILFSDLAVFQTLQNSIPNNYNLHLSNSSTVRYSQLFSIHKSIHVFCNRGTSGIDGSTSTAIGCAISTTKPTLLITGDLSFFYDSNALWNNYIPNTFRVILINNQGGGIFRILPGNKNTTNFDTYFETIHHLNAKALCSMYNFEYLQAEDDVSLKTQLENFYNLKNKPKLLEIFTPRTVNDKVLLEFFKQITLAHDKNIID